MMKLKGRLAPKVKLPKINKCENTGKKEYPPFIILKDGKVY
jgi:ribosomal protein L32